MELDASPEEMRKQAAEEKNKYKALKGEGKSEEALKAFKRGKELERQVQIVEPAKLSNIQHLTIRPIENWSFKTGISVLISATRLFPIEWYELKLTLRNFGNISRRSRIWFR
ncbi:unnamed protein product [Microthlaspi erraticum]|uniref:Uncharacterized protein n=1 Tax=Microthlaspi erraticum TaxID=1685480 RepID=A0A6D2IXD1_9BRAS|nr:unnamed protein product [Microthlaspi erraticum]